MLKHQQLWLPELYCINTVKFTVIYYKLDFFLFFTVHSLQQSQTSAEVRRSMAPLKNRLYSQKTESFKHSRSLQKEMKTTNTVLIFKKCKATGTVPNTRACSGSITKWAWAHFIPRMHMGTSIILHELRPPGWLVLQWMGRTTKAESSSPFLTLGLLTTRLTDL